MKSINWYWIVRPLIMLVVICVMQLPVVNAAVISTDSIEVHGNCGMCKNRIEKAALKKGVKSAIWSPKTKILVLKYDSEKINPEEIEQHIASVGHDTPKVKASDEAYNNLPDCCQYDR